MRFSVYTNATAPRHNLLILNYYSVRYLFVCEPDGIRTVWATNVIFRLPSRWCHIWLEPRWQYHRRIVSATRLKTCYDQQKYKRFYANKLWPMPSFMIAMKIGCLNIFLFPIRTHTHTHVRTRIGMSLEKMYLQSYGPFYGVGPSDVGCVKVLRIFWV